MSNPSGVLTNVLSIRVTAAEARRLRRAARRSPQRALSPYLLTLVKIGQAALAAEAQRVVDSTVGDP